MLKEYLEVFGNIAVVATNPKPMGMRCDVRLAFIRTNFANLTNLNDSFITTCSNIYRHLCINSSIITHCRARYVITIQLQIERRKYAINYFINSKQWKIIILNQLINFESMKSSKRTNQIRLNERCRSIKFAVSVLNCFTLSTPSTDNI